MERITLQLQAGDVNLTLSQYKTPNLLTLTELDGWDNFAEISLETVDKGIGIGSYVVNRHVGQRTLSLTFNTVEPNGREQLVKLQAVLLSGVTFTANRRWYSPTAPASVLRRERLQGGMLTNVNYRRLDDRNTDISLTITFPDPLKTVFLDGNATAETQRTL